MDNEQRAHDLTVLIIEKMLKTDMIQINPNPMNTSTEVAKYYTLYKNNLISILEKSSK